MNANSEHALQHTDFLQKIALSLETKVHSQFIIFIYSVFVLQGLQRKFIEERSYSYSFVGQNKTVFHRWNFQLFLCVISVEAGDLDLYLLKFR